MSKKELVKYLIQNNMEIPLLQITVSMLAALAIALCVYQIYRFTYSGVMYSSDFNTTIVMLALVTTLVIMIIGSNLALSLGLVGALSIIRFRTAVKDARDAGFLFWSIGVGLACGTAAYTIGIIGSAVIGAALLFLHFVRRADDQAYLLVIRSKKLEPGKIEQFLKENTKRFRLRMTDRNDGAEEITYELVLKKEGGGFAELLREKDFCKEFHLISYKGELAGE